MDRLRPRPVVDLRTLVGLLGTWSAGNEPLFRQLADALDRLIELGDLRAGDRLPPERDLARALAVSRSTVVAALDQLRTDGRLASRQGSGTWVPDRRTPIPTVDERTRFLDAMARNPLVTGVMSTSTNTIFLSAAVTVARPETMGPALAAIDEDLALDAEDHGYAPFGIAPLREAIAAHYTRLGIPTRASQVLVTSGAQQAISLLTSALVVPGVPVVVEDPTFVVALDAFRAASAELVGVPVQAGMPEAAALRDRLSRARPAFAYLVPTNQNPTGSTTPVDARRAIAEMAVETGVPIIEDQALIGLEHGDQPTPLPIAVHAPQGPILTIGSLSKPAWGGLRIGWIRGPEPFITRVGRMKVINDYGSSVLSSVVAVRIVARLPELYAERRVEMTANADLLAQLLATHLPDWRWDRPTGGVTAWVRLPVGDASAFVQVALRHGVAVIAGSLLSASGSFDDHVRIAFGERDKLEEGVRRLAAAWRAYRVDLADVDTERLAWVV